MHFRPLRRAVPTAAVLAWICGSAGRADVFQMPAGVASVEMLPVDAPGNPADAHGRGAVP